MEGDGGGEGRKALFISFLFCTFRCCLFVCLSVCFANGGGVGGGGGRKALFSFCFVLLGVVCLFVCFANAGGVWEGGGGEKHHFCFVLYF